jgi:hypothetical protein
MVTALTQFERLQLGIEVVTTKGTAVPATRQIVGNHAFSEEQDFYRSPYPAGFLANVGGAGTIMRKGVAVDIDTELSAEDVLWPLMTGVLGSVTPSTVDTSGKSWLFTPQLTTGVKTIQSATAEFIRGDGTTNHYYGESSYLMTESFKFDWNFNQIAKMGARMFGRARQTDTPTSSLVPYATREALASNTLTIYWDTTYAGLGGTPVTGIVRSCSFDCKTGYEPDYTIEGRTDVDMTVHKVGPITANLSMVLEFDATAAAKFVLYRSNSLVYIRLKNTGSLCGAVSAVRTVQVDGAYRFTASPTFTQDGSQVLMNATLESVYDTTGTKTLEFTAINALAAIT